MSEKITIKDIVFEGTMELKSRRLQTVTGFINNQMNKIPEEYRSVATWSMGVPDGSNGDVKLVIAYKRLETDEENAARDEGDAIVAQAEYNKRVEEATAIAEQYPGILQVIS